MIEVFNNPVFVSVSAVCLQTAACAAKLGIECELVLSGEEPSAIIGNLLLFKILDVMIHLVNDSQERKSRMSEREEELKSNGRKPYLIPTGGSNALGALGYVNCLAEIKEQAKALDVNFDFFVHAAGSSGTQAGMLIGKELVSI